VSSSSSCGSFGGNNIWKKGISHSVGISVAGCIAGKVGSVDWWDNHQSGESMPAGLSICKGWLMVDPLSQVCFTADQPIALRASHST
jgi:hypothetical protein